MPARAAAARGERSSRHLTDWSILCFSFLLLSFARASAQEASYDGRWWLALSNAEKENFISGVSDCYVYDVGGRRYDSRPASVMAARLTIFYKMHPQKEGIPALLVARTLSQPKAPWASARHGYFDGDYWRQSSRRERLAFVRGYIACRNFYLHSQITNPAESYADKLSAWYRTSDTDPSELSEKTGNDKIGDVLDRIFGH